MGLYDNFSLPTGGQYISTYAGLPLEEVTALGQNLENNYMKGLEGASAFNVMRDNIRTLDKDSEFKDGILDKVSSELNAFAERGDYENSIPAIMRATSSVAGNKRLRKAMKGYTDMTEFKTNLEKMVMQQKLPQWRADLALSRASEYKGVSEDDNIKNYLKYPGKDVDLGTAFRDAAKIVKPTYTDAKVTPDPKTGKWKSVRYEIYDPIEIENQLNAVLATPEVANYLDEMRQYYGDEYTDTYISNYKESIKQAINTQKPIIQYISPEDGFGLNQGNQVDQSAAQGVLPATDRTSGPENISNEEIRNDVYVNDQKQVLVDKRRALKEDEGNPGFLGGLTDMLGDLFTGLGLTAQEMALPVTTLGEDKVLNQDSKTIDAVKNTYNIDEKTWSDLGEQGQQQVVEDWIAKNKDYKRLTSYSQLDPMDEARSGHIKNPNSADQASMAKGVQYYVKTNAPSLPIYDIDEGELINNSGENEFLSEAIANDRITVVGVADARNPYAKVNPEFSNSYIIRASNKEGTETKTYLIPRDEMYKKSINGDMKKYPMDGAVTNDMYNSTVSEIYNTFDGVGFNHTLDVAKDVSIDGYRAVDGEGNPGDIVLTKISTPNGDINIRQLAEALGIPVPNSNGGSPYVTFDDHTVAQLVLYIKDKYGRGK